MQALISDILVNYEILGTNAKSPILILHGWKRNLDDWKPIGSLLAQNHQVVLVDLPGMGSSSLPQTIFGTYDYANLISELIKKLSLQNVTLIGHSFGGKISTIIASNDNSIKKLILIDASGINQKSLSVNFKIFLSKIIKPFSFLLPKNIMTSDDYKSAGSLLPVFKKVVNEYVNGDAKKITVPTLIIWGDKDKEVSVTHAKVFKTLIPNSTLRIVWGTGHDPFLEKPNKFLEILYEYL